MLVADSGKDGAAETPVQNEITVFTIDAQQKILANSRFLCEVESKLSMLADEVDANYADLKSQIEAHSAAAADRFIALETPTVSDPHAQGGRVIGVKRPRDNMTRRTAPSIVFCGGQRIKLKTDFSLDMLSFIKDATSKLADQDQRVRYCDEHHIHIGALIRRLRRTFRGRQYDGTWWWEAGIQSTFLAPPNFTQAKK